MAQLEQSFESIYIDAEKKRYDKEQRLRPLMRPDIKKPATPPPESKTKKIVWADEVGLALS